jgi:hypothetical protein
LQRDGLRSGAASPPAEEGEARFCRLRGGTELQLGRRWSWRAGTRTSNQWVGGWTKATSREGRRREGRGRGRARRGRARGLEAGHGESRCDTSERGSGDVGEEGLTSKRTQATGQTTTRRCSGPAQGISWRLGEWFGEAEKGGEERGEERRGGIGVCDRLNRLGERGRGRLRAAGGQRAGAQPRRRVIQFGRQYDTGGHYRAVVRPTGWISGYVMYAIDSAP